MFIGWTTIHQVLIGGQMHSGTTFTAVDTPTLESLSGGSDGSSVTNAQKKLLTKNLKTQKQ